MSSPTPSVNTLNRHDRRPFTFRIIARVLSVGGLACGAIAFLPLCVGIGTFLFNDGNSEQFKFLAAVAFGYVVTIGYIGRSFTQLRPSTVEIVWAKATWLLSTLVQGWWALPLFIESLKDGSLESPHSSNIDISTIWWVSAFAVSLCGLLLDFTPELLHSKKA